MKTRGKERTTPTQLIRIAKARHLAGVTIFRLTICHTHCITANRTTVSTDSTPFHNLLKTPIRRKIQLKKQRSCLLQVPVVDVLSKVVLNISYVQVNTA